MLTEISSTIGAFWFWLREGNGTSFANLTSIVGFGFTVYVLITVKQLKRGYFVKARMPALLERLTQHGTVLSEGLGVAPDANKMLQIRVELEKTKRTLHDLKDKVPRDRRGTIDKAIATIKSYPTGSAMPENFLMELYIDILACLDDMKEYLKDVDWMKA